MSIIKVLLDAGLGLCALVMLIVGLRTGTMPSILGWSADEAASRKSNPAMFWFYAFLLSVAVMGASVIGYFFMTSRYP